MTTPNAANDKTDYERAMEILAIKNCALTSLKEKGVDCSNALIYKDELQTLVSTLESLHTENARLREENERLESADSIVDDSAYVELFNKESDT